MITYVSLTPTGAFPPNLLHSVVPRGGDMTRTVRGFLFLTTLAVSAAMGASVPATVAAGGRAAEGKVVAEGGVTAFTRKVIGAARGQTVRYTWTNLIDPAVHPTARPTRVRFTLFAPDGTPVRQTSAPAPAPGEMQWFDVARDDIDLPGEPGTARLQLRVEVAIEFTRVNKIDGFTIKQAVVAERFPASLEIINADGTTQVYASDIATFLNIEFDGEVIR